MNFFKDKLTDIQKIAILWAITIFSLVVIFFSFTSWSFIKVDAIVIWLFSIMVVLYISRKNSSYSVSREFKIFFVLLGVLTVLLSFLNIPLGFGNPPYSIGDFSLFLSGCSLIVFGYLGLRSFIIPVSFPAIAVLLFQFYELFIRSQINIIATPLISPIVIITALILTAFGIPVTTNNDLITIISKTGSPVNLVITSECTGIWSLGTFTIAALIILVAFKEARTKTGYFLIFIGYLGTYVSNIGRIALISIMGYQYGSYSVIRATHDYFAWLIFSIWMLIFWYFFLVKFLKISFFQKRENNAP